MNLITELNELLEDWSHLSDDRGYACRYIEAAINELTASYQKIRELDERLDATPSQNTINYYVNALSRAYDERDALKQAIFEHKFKVENYITSKNEIVSLIDEDLWANIEK
jgi:hypothetical protein